MSFYNVMNGVNKGVVFLILPMLDRHPDKYPRFRDCFLADKDHPEYDNFIQVYTRVGGGNRGCGYGEEELMNDPNFVTTFNDSLDSTYGTYVFNVPDKWKDDFKKITSGDLKSVSDDYKNQIKKVYPKLSDQIDLIFPA